ncbi:TrmB family transcriptional regulator [Fervidicoccus fontis]|uniref:TrmB family transcriptional regulator n=1 Tax=Fervidicoccus fontis TaxID=683846 RepID=A0A2J6N5B7_9CREN|nr:helix-turn-helix domain-containing protein [Fervidicoccus fontis]PMB75815.1 MAG: hypothetical protein C0188_01755 [Fervidicoccus fontis]PMB76534.1 MAG: hypothetical protein C0177_05995 [Fervidicoccus fontis]HEW63862.1 TrmB family transcriptional regulator [Fervidicoccus fontis]
MIENSNLPQFIISEVEPLLKLLKVYGMKKRDIEIYLRLLNSGGLTAKELSVMTGLPQSKVYESLSKLIEKGWVMKSSDRPSIFYPVNIAEVWNETKHEISKKMEEVETKVIPLLERASVGSPPLFRIFLLSEGKIQYYIEKVFSKASKEVLIAISHKEIINDEFFEKISSLKDKGAKIWMIITKGVYEFLKDKNIMVRENYKIADEMFGSGIISDEILLIFKNGNQLNALWSDHNYFVELGKIYFEHLWSH